MPQSLQEKDGQFGPMILITCADGTKYSAFDDNVAKLQGTNGFQVDIEWEQKGRYANISKVYSVTAEKVDVSDYGKQHNISEGNRQKAEPFQESRKEKTAAVLTSYAKDIWSDLPSDSAASLNECAKEVVDAYKLILGEL